MHDEGKEEVNETLEEFRSRIAARLDAHFAKLKPAIEAINAGFATTSSRAQARAGEAALMRARRQLP